MSLVGRKRLEEIGKYLRSPRGQLSLLGVTYCGAVVLALVSIAVRSVFFERFVREKFPPLSGHLAALAQEVAAGDRPATAVEKLSDPEVRLLYGSLVNGLAGDAEKRLTRSLVRFHATAVLRRIRVTFVVGSREQRVRALEIIRQWPRDELDELEAERIELCRFLAERARRAGDERLAMLAATATHDTGAE